METLKPPSVQPSVRTAPSSTRAVTPDSATGYAPPRDDVRWLRRLAEELAARRVTPVKVQYAGLGAAALAVVLIISGTMIRSGLGTTALVVAAACIQIRFLCELVAIRMDGPAPADVPLFFGIPDLAADA